MLHPGLFSQPDEGFQVLSVEGIGITFRLGIRP
jgi:hypothetical protein